MGDPNYVFGSLTQPTDLDKKSEIFLTSGACSDETVLLFDDGNKLFVSENFLSYASPVFNAMFEHQFKERETREVKMKEKSFEDFQEFLLCLHPGKQKPIDQNNVLRVVDLAQEYLVEGAVNRCKEVMQKWLGENVATDKASHVKTCLQILQKSIACGYNELITHAIKTIASFKHKLYTGAKIQSKTNSGFSFGSTVLPAKFQPFTFGAPALPSNVMFACSSTISAQHLTIEDCKKLFEGLPEKVKTEILLERLRLCDN